MNAEWAKNWIDLVQCLFMVWIFLANRSAVTKAQVEEKIQNLEQRIAEKDTRIVRLEQALLHLPTHGDLADAVEKISAVHANVSELTGSVNGLRAAVDLMNRHLLGERP